MSTPEIDTSLWAEYFDSIAPGLQGLLVTIEIMSEQIGDQTDVERLPFRGISYDPKDDVLEISVGGRGTRYPVVLRHFIPSPKVIRVEGSSGLRPKTIFVEDAGSTRTLMRFYDLLTLEP